MEDNRTDQVVGPRKKLLIVISGAASSMFAPFHLNWVKLIYPQCELRLIVTRGALKFVTVEALAAVSGTLPIVDDWDATATGRSIHVELADWADAVIVWPATFGYVNRYVSGVGDTPSHLTLHGSRAPKYFAPAFPPGIPAGKWVEALADMPEVIVADFVPARSGGTGTIEKSGGYPLVSIVERIIERKQ